MKAQEMWKVADGSGITVAVIDSGVKDQPASPTCVDPELSESGSPGV
ncbi:hypothetical protein OG247_01580 [Streptomyces sp. NBC_01244]|nr:hypothetical protein OG247_01580 [Streptomyces sp. NBC_01244]